MFNIKSGSFYLTRITRLLKIVPILSAFILQLLISFSVLGQDIDVILKRHFQAMGHANLESIRSLKMDVTEVDGFGQGRKYEVIKKRPYRIRKEGEDTGKHFIEAFDGDTAWYWTPERQNAPMVLDSARKNQLMVEAIIGSPLLLSEREGYRVILEGSGYVGRQSNYIVRLLMPDYYFMDFYIDKKSYLLSKIVTFKDLFTKEVDTQIYFEDYRQLGPFLFPFQMQRKHGDDEPLDVIVGEIAVGVGASNSVFKYPKD